MTGEQRPGPQGEYSTALAPVRPPRPGPGGHLVALLAVGSVVAAVLVASVSSRAPSPNPLTGSGLAARPAGEATSEPPRASLGAGPTAATGLTLALAVGIAVASAGGGEKTSVLSARKLRGDVTTSGVGAPGNAWVWAVVLRGSFLPTACGPTPASNAACRTPATSELVVIDYETGLVIDAVAPAPG